MEKDVINLCPVCFKQGKKTYMEEADDGSENVRCAVHGVISCKYWHDLFIEPSNAELSCGGLFAV